MEIKYKPTKSWIKRRGKKAQYRGSKSQKLSVDLGRDGRYPFIVPAAIPYEKFISYRLITTGFFN